MKKLIIICLLALTYTSANAQEPTKQETMDWIAGKMKQYLQAPREFISYQNNIFTYKIKNPDNTFERGNYYNEYWLSEIYLEKITQYSLWGGGAWVPEIEGNNLMKTTTFLNGKLIEVSYENYITIARFNYNDGPLIFDFQLESCLNGCYQNCRVRKALDVLIKNQVAGKNEKY